MPDSNNKREKDRLDEVARDTSITAAGEQGARAANAARKDDAEDAARLILPRVDMEDQPLSSPVREARKDESNEAVFEGGRGVGKDRKPLYDRLKEQGFSNEEAARLSISLTTTPDTLRNQIDKWGLVVPNIPASGKEA